MLSDFVPRGLKKTIEKFPVISFLVGLVLFYIITSGLIETFTRTFFVLFPIISLFLVWVCIDSINQVKERSTNYKKSGIDNIRDKFCWSFLINYFVFDLLDNKILTTFGEKYIKGFYSIEQEENYTNPEIDTYITYHDYYCDDRTWESILNYYDLTFMIISIILTIYFYVRYNEIKYSRT